MPESDWVFVFGSNLAGRHGAGAALEAREKYGAKTGVGQGPTGQAYAIPTKDEKLRVLPLGRIRLYALEFICYAEEHPELNFFVTRVGCGLAGYKDEEVAPLFRGYPDNCRMPFEWVALLSHSDQSEGKEER